jgi:hypothetical protein
MKMKDQKEVGRKKESVDGQLPRFDASSNLVESQQMAIGIMADTHVHVQVEDLPRSNKEGFLLLNMTSHSTPLTEDEYDNWIILIPR